jgi:hypothetical protein
LAILAMSIWLMWVGLRDDRGLPFAGGVLFSLQWVIMRYIDLFGGAGGMLGAALMFFLCGLAIAGLAVFWHERKKVVHVS